MCCLIFFSLLQLLWCRKVVIDLILLSFWSFNACVNKVWLVWEGGFNQCIWLCVIHHHVECLLRSSVSAHLWMLKYCSGEERMVGWLLLIVLPLGRGEVGVLLPISAPSQECTFRKSRVPQYCWGVGGEAGWHKEWLLEGTNFTPSDGLRSRRSQILL